MSSVQNESQCLYIPENICLLSSDQKFVCLAAQNREEWSPIQCLLRTQLQSASRGHPDCKQCNWQYFFPMLNYFLDGFWLWSFSKYSFDGFWLWSFRSIFSIFSGDQVSGTHVHSILFQVALKPLM